MGRFVVWGALLGLALGMPPVSAQFPVPDASSCINAQQNGDEVRFSNLCQRVVNLSFCVQGNPRSELKCPASGVDRVAAGAFATAKAAALQGGRVIWAACFEPQNPTAFNGETFHCR